MLTRRISLLKITVYLSGLLIVGATSALANVGNGFSPSAGQIKISAVSPSDKWVGLYNTGDTAVDLAGWVLYDENDSHELFITKSNIVGEVPSSAEACPTLSFRRAPADKREFPLLVPRSEITISGKDDADFTLSNKGGRVKLFSGPVEMEGALQDEVDYPAINPDENYEVISDDESNENKNQESIEEEVVTSNQNNPTDISYKTPEENSGFKPSTQVSGDEQKTVDGKNDLHSGKNKDDSHTESDSGVGSGSNSKVGSTSNIKSDSSVDSGFNPESTENIDANVNTNVDVSDTNAGATFTASSGMEKSPYAWFYRLWGNWFLWRVILPFLALWAALYWVIRYIQKKYLS